MSWNRRRTGVRHMSMSGTGRARLLLWVAVGTFGGTIHCEGHSTRSPVRSVEPRNKKGCGPESAALSSQLFRGETLGGEAERLRAWFNAGG